MISCSDHDRVVEAPLPNSQTPTKLAQLTWVDVDNQEQRRLRKQTRQAYSSRGTTNTPRLARDSNLQLPRTNNLSAILYHRNQLRVSAKRTNIPLNNFGPRSVLPGYDSQYVACCSTW